MTTEQNGKSNGKDVEIQRLDPQPTLSIRATIRIEQLGEAMGDRIEALRTYLQQQGAQSAGPPFVRYHTFGETETDLETGIPVAAPIAGEGRITSSELPGGPAATTWHIGAHDKLGEAYARIASWQKEQSREADGAAWEVYYWIDLNQTLDPTTWDPATSRTQLVQPLR